MLNTPFLPMLLQPSTTIPTGPNYTFQLKLDGHRTLLHYDHGNVRVFTRMMNEVTYKYPELNNISLPVDTCILDGELICFDTEANPPNPCFDSLTTRFQTSKIDRINSLVHSLPVSFSAFDIIYINGQRLINEPLSYRLNKLQSLITNNSYISLCPTFPEGEHLFESVKTQGLEGIVAKDLSTPYKFNSRPSYWKKIKAYQSGVIQISAIRKKKFGWMMLEGGQYKGVLEFVPPNERKAFYTISKQLIQGEDENYIYLDPVIQCKVKYQCLSKKGLMRSASFVEFIY